MKAVLLYFIRYYRSFISMWKPPCCRFYPTCSTYALRAVEEHGALRGSFLALKRLLKCHPFHPGGYDPVPDAAGSKNGQALIYGYRETAQENPDYL